MILLVRMPLTILCKQIKGPITFEVVDSTMKPYPLLGCETCLDLGSVKLTESTYAMKDAELLTKEQILTQYDEVFCGLEEMPGEY